MKIIRYFLGRLLLSLDRIFAPKALKRALDQQAEVDKKTSDYALFQFEACPFCIKVRRALKRMNLSIELIDILKDKKSEDDLIRGGGKRQVPCLRIKLEDGSYKWIYESNDIINFLEKELA